MNHSERQSWIKQHLKVFPVANTLLMQFRASIEDGDDAADIANAAAAAYCEVRRARARETGQGREQGEVEIMEPATGPFKPDEKPNPLMAGLVGGLPDVSLFMLGAAIGYLGFLAEKIRGKLVRPPRDCSGIG